MEKKKKASSGADKKILAPENKKTAKSPAVVKKKNNEGSKEGKKSLPPKKNNNKEKVEAFPESKREKRIVHQIMPYFLMALSIFIVASFFFIDVLDGIRLEDGVGFVGKWIRDVLCGLFGIGAFVIPVVIASLAISYRDAVEKNSILARVFYTIIVSVFLSAFLHVIVDSATEIDVLFGNVKELYSKGMELVGGGAIGGFLGELMREKLFGTFGALMIAGIVTVLFAIFLFGLSPKKVATYVVYTAKINKEKRAVRREENKEKKRILAEEKAEEARIRAEEKAKEEKLRREEKERLEAELKAKEEKLAEEKRLAEEARLAKEARRAEEERLAEEARREELARIIVPPVEEKREEPKKPVADNPEDMKEMLHEVFGGNGEKKIKDTSEPALNAENNKAKPAQNEEVYEDSVLSSMKEVDTTESVDDIVDGDDVEEIYIEDEEKFEEYVFPTIDLLTEDNNKAEGDYSEELKKNAETLVDTLRSFNVKIKEITYSRGPTITRYELKPDVGVRVRAIANLVDDIALNLATIGVRIEAPIPNKPAVGIEVPNANPSTVFLRSLIDSERFTGEQSKLTACLGADVGGKPVYFNIAKMPHLLIAGATGMGKSVCINSIIISLLYKARPDEVKLILIDPKKVEFTMYKDIPHLYCPIVSDPQKAAGALASAVAEMERRFALIEEVGVRNIFGYNDATKDDPDREYMPQMVIIIDELADLMMTAADSVESSICRLAQKARAAGIHIIIGTQRPSVDVITGLIKANIPSRIACTVASQVDSKTIIDMGGAERLIGKGDMLFAPVGASKPIRVQGAFVSDGEVERVVEFVKSNNNKAKYNEEFVKRIDEEAAKCASGKKGSAPSGDASEIEGGLDPKFKEAVELAIDSGKISTSLLQRRLTVGYGRAAKIIDQMEEMGYVSAADGNKPRKILITKEDFMQIVINDEI